MKKTIAKLMARTAEKCVEKANKTACIGFTYQPKAPKGIKGFTK